MTRTERAEYQRAWRKAHPEYRRDWDKRNADSCRAARRKWRKDNPDLERKRKRDLARKYAGIPTPAHPAPDGCECCGGPPNGRSTVLVADHSHRTGQPRGWLCSRCNRILGFLGDELEAVERKVGQFRAYLNKYSARAEEK